MEQIKEFIFSLGISPKLKNELASDELLLKHQFYLQLARYLAPVFPAVDAVSLHKLTGHSYLYFRFLLGLDSLVDEQVGINGHSVDPKLLFNYVEIHEQAIRGLAQLFPEHDKFWPAFEVCKQEYAHANGREKQISEQRTNFSMELFEQIASGKSAVCYAMAHALNSLSRDAGPVEELQRCLQHLHIAMQVLDDVEDFKQDWQNGQFTYVYSLVEDYLATKDIAANELPIEKLHRCLYTSGVAQQLLQWGCNHYDSSITIAQSLGLVELSQYIEQQATKCKNYHQDVEWLLQKARIKADKSLVFLHSEAPDLSPQHLQTAIRKALQHLRYSRDAQGCWLDFMTSAGPSKLWATSFVGLHLAETKEGLSLAYDAFNASFHLPSSYNESVLQDGDSANFGMGLRRKVWGETTPGQLKEWLHFMDADGGWVTYRDADELRKRLSLTSQASVADWLTPKLCVTAAAAYVLTLYKELAPQHRASCSYLVQHQHPDGFWQSYWWTSPVYATAYAALALAPLPEHQDSLEKALEWLVTQQAEEGAWYDSSSAAQPNAFFTALAVKALLTNPTEKNTTAIKLSVNWLLSHQMSDGSWVTPPILRIPATDVHDPRTVKHWRNSSFGVNVLVDDHNRTFTTSTVLNALDTFAKATETTPA